MKNGVGRLFQKVPIRFLPQGCAHCVVRLVMKSEWTEIGAALKGVALLAWCWRAWRVLRPATHGRRSVDRFLLRPRQRLVECGLGAVDLPLQVLVARVALEGRHGVVVGLALVSCGHFLFRSFDGMGRYKRRRSPHRCAALVTSVRLIDAGSVKAFRANLQGRAASDVAQPSL